MPQGYTLIADVGGHTQRILSPDAGTRQTCTFQGLTIGQTYRFCVVAHNDFGTSEPSLLSTEVVPVPSESVP